MTLIYVNKIHDCLYICLLNINCDNPSVVDLGLVLYQLYSGLFLGGFNKNIFFSQFKKRRPA